MKNVTEEWLAFVIGKLGPVIVEIISRETGFVWQVRCMGKDGRELVDWNENLAEALRHLALTD